MTEQEHANHDTMQREGVWDLRLLSIFGMLVLMGMLVLIAQQVQIHNIKKHEHQECLNAQRIVQALRDHDPGINVGGRHTFVICED